MSRRVAKPRTGSPELDAAIVALVDGAGVQHDRDLVVEMVASVLKISRDGNTRGDMKIVNTALRELRASYRAFRPYRDRRKCAIFGSARVPVESPAFAAAQAVGAELAERGWMTITGGGPGIMTAGLIGAGAANSFGVTIRLPFESSEGGGLLPADRLVRFRYFFTRKLTFMKESSAYVVFPGGFGTLDETFELLTLMQTGKEPVSPIVLFDPVGATYWSEWLDFVRGELVPGGFVSPEDLDLVFLTSSVTAAAAYICDFYDVFHSMRYVNGLLVIRLNRDIDDARLAALNATFGDILTPGTVIERTAALPAEVDDHDEVALPRLIMAFDNRHFARLHQLVRSLGGELPAGRVPVAAP
jgi:uncharacterized protein (TIGR00730 family)